MKGKCPPAESPPTPPTVSGREPAKTNPAGNISPSPAHGPSQLPVPLIDLIIGIDLGQEYGVQTLLAQKRSHMLSICLRGPNSTEICDRRRARNRDVYSMCEAGWLILATRRSRANYYSILTLKLIIALANIFYVITKALQTRGHDMTGLARIRFAG
jgi:hypothetical protein